MTEKGDNRAMDTPEVTILAPESTSADIGKLAEALAKAQAKLEQPQKNKTATIKMKAGGQYSYKYGDLPAVIESLKSVLPENGLSYVQRMRIDNNRLILETRLMHASGQWIASEWPLEVSKDPKETASSLTYGRRYSLTSLCGISAEETDDDDERRNQGKDEPVIGALTKSKLQQQMRQFDTDLQACTDEGMLVPLLASYNDALAQCERDLPSWYYTKQNSDVEGIKDRIYHKQREIAYAEKEPHQEPASDQEEGPEETPAERYFAQTERNIAECEITEDLAAFEEASQEHIDAFGDDSLTRRLKNKFATRRVELGKLEPTMV